MTVNPALACLQSSEVPSPASFFGIRDDVPVFQLLDEFSPSVISSLEY